MWPVNTNKMKSSLSPDHTCTDYTLLIGQLKDDRKQEERDTQQRASGQTNPRTKPLYMGPALPAELMDAALITPALITPNHTCTVHLITPALIIQQNPPKRDLFCSFPQVTSELSVIVKLTFTCQFSQVCKQWNTFKLPQWSHLVCWCEHLVQTDHLHLTTTKTTIIKQQFRYLTNRQPDCARQTRDRNEGDEKQWWSQETVKGTSE